MTVEKQAFNEHELWELRDELARDRVGHLASSRSVEIKPVPEIEEVQRIHPHTQEQPDIHEPLAA